MGIILFWAHYIVAFFLLYHVLFCIYIKDKREDRGRKTYYSKTDKDKRLRHPVWLWIVFIISLFIPILNLFLFVGYILFKVVNEEGSEVNPYYVKSTFTKEL